MHVVVRICKTSPMVRLAALERQRIQLQQPFVTLLVCLSIACQSSTNSDAHSGGTIAEQISTRTTIIDQYHDQHLWLARSNSPCTLKAPGSRSSFQQASCQRNSASIGYSPRKHARLIRKTPTWQPIFPPPICKFVSLALVQVSSTHLGAPWKPRGLRHSSNQYPGAALGFSSHGCSMRSLPVVVMHPQSVDHQPSAINNLV